MFSLHLLMESRIGQAFRVSLAFCGTRSPACAGLEACVRPGELPVLLVLILQLADGQMDNAFFLGTQEAELDGFLRGDPGREGGN